LELLLLIEELLKAVGESLIGEVETTILFVKVVVIIKVLVILVS